MALISAADLLARIRRRDARLRVCDVRWYLGKPGAGRAAYEAGHVPGAVFVDLDADLSGPGAGRHPLPDATHFARRMGALGIGREHQVVAYDDTGGGVAARLWWMLDNLGHPDVSILDGGLQAWIDAGGEVTAEVPAWPPVEPALAETWTRTIDREGLKARLGEVVVIDARAGERYRGETEPVDPVAGHIPTAQSVPGTGNLGPDGRFRSPDALRERFEAVGLSGEVVTTCGSGVNACQNALAMRVAGLPDPILYPGSYSDWSRSGYPAATGAAPGSLPD